MFDTNEFSIGVNYFIADWITTTELHDLIDRAKAVVDCNLLVLFNTQASIMVLKLLGQSAGERIMSELDAWTAKTLARYGLSRSTVAEFMFQRSSEYCREFANPDEEQHAWLLSSRFHGFCDQSASGPSGLSERMCVATEITCFRGCLWDHMPVLVQCSSS